MSVPPKMLVDSDWLSRKLSTDPDLYGEPVKAPLALTGVSATLTARHVDLLMDEGEHQHTWTVTAWYPSEPFRDGRALRAALVALLGAWEGTTLPEELWSGEALAAAVMRLLANCVGCDISRPEGYHASVRM